MCEQKFRTGICPGCRKEIRVPEELSSFSCVYCGARLTPEELLIEKAEKQSNDVQTLIRELGDAVPDAVLARPDVLKNLTEKKYPGFFREYVEEYRSVFQKITQVCAGKNSVSNADELARVVLDRLQEKTGGKRLEDVKFTLCLLTVPAIRSLGYMGCEDFCKSLHKLWMERYPKNPFALTTYEQIASGFQRKKLCFITTAVCEQAGKPDDCPELTAFRHFRDDYLSRQPGGTELIRSYYDIAPRVVTVIDLCDQRNQVYPKIWKTWLEPCYEALKKKEYSRVCTIYVQMVKTLAEYYLGEEL